MRVYTAASDKLRVSGECHEGEKKWRRFCKDFQMPPDSDTKEITANFENGILYVKVPKSTHPTNLLQEETKPPTQETPGPQMLPNNQPPHKKNGYQEKAAEKVPSKTSHEKQPRNKPSDVNKERSYMDEIKEKSASTDSCRYSTENKLKEEKNGKGKIDGLAANVDKRAEKKKEITTAAMSLSNSAKYKRLTNLVMAGIFLLLIGFYAKNTIFKSKGESKRAEL